MTIERIAIPDVVLLTPRRFGEPRSYFAETFKARPFLDTVAPYKFVPD